MKILVTGAAGFIGSHLWRCCNGNIVYLGLGGSIGVSLGYRQIDGICAILGIFMGWVLIGANGGISEVPLP